MGKEPLTLSRGEGYIGVMIDDLILKGADEPCSYFLHLMKTTYYDPDFLP